MTATGDGRPPSIVARVPLPMRSVDDGLVALSARAAAELAGLSRRQLRYWAETGLVTPSIGTTGHGGGGTLLYAFRDVLELLVAAALRERFTLQHVRRVVARLRGQGYEHPLAELRFAVQGDEIFFRHPDGAWEGDRRPDQAVLQHVVPLDELRDRIRLAVAAGRDRAHRGDVERRRNVQASLPVFAGTRTPVQSLFSYLDRRASTERVLEAFPHLTRAEVAAARRRWRAAGGG